MAPRGGVTTLTSRGDDPDSPRGDVVWRRRYHNRRVTVEVLRHERVSIGLWRRRVRIAVDGTPACFASSVVVAQTRTAIDQMDKKGGLGQLFSALGGKQDFSLLEVAKDDATFSRVYTLANAHLVCHIEEVMPLNLFEDDFFTASSRWHPEVLESGDVDLLDAAVGGAW